MIKFILLVFISLTLSANIQVTLKESAVANGRCFLLKSKESGFLKHYVAFAGKRYNFFPTKVDTQNNYYALVPVNYYAKLKSEKLVVVVVDTSGKKRYKTFPVQIIDGNYKKEQLKVAPSKAKFSTKNKALISKEYKEAMHIYNTITPTPFWNTSFTYPMQTKITSAFGNKRLFNNSLKSYHSGTDFRAKMGTPIYSVNSGKVVLVKKRYFAGNSVLLDHGEGIYTGYYHMSKFKVKKGQFVKKGQLLGLAGATGRVTGPHLHFSVRIGGVQVDPLQALKLLNEI